ncbi:MAG: phosphatidate cytidylyltransferase, partial [Clostridia bacterium]|nr:phosphatidate cytidylyltransferase [Clostridia bacterium]
VLLLGIFVSPLFITAFVGLLAAGGVYELVNKAANIKFKKAWIASSVFAFLTVIVKDNWISNIIQEPMLSSFYNPEKQFLYFLARKWFIIPYALTVLYFVYAVAVILKHHKDFDLAKIITFTAMPLFLSYAFSCFSGIIGGDNGIYYLLMLLNFSSICDMGAYFVGVTIGKHKLCPQISPKKTVEGAIGGIVSSIIFSVIFVFAFGHTEKIVSTLIVTVPLCIVGMMGDLFASSIKRSVGLKDYSNLIPGHGGILDRVDSILMIAPVLYLFALFGVI